MFWRRRRDDDEAGRAPEPPTELPEEPSRRREPEPSAHASARGPASWSRRAPHRRSPSPTPSAEPAPAPRRPVGPGHRAAAARGRGRLRPRPRRGRAARSSAGCAASSGGDQTDWDEVEETLIAADVGATLAAEVVEKARRRRDRDAEAAVRRELAALLVEREPGWSPRPSPSGGPAIMLVVGVNGTGKTTTIGKLAARYKAEGRRVLLAAADTFRAAADRPAPRLGRAGRRRDRRPQARTPIRAPSSTTRSTRRSPAARTSSSPTPPAASTRRPT